MGLLFEDDDRWKARRSARRIHLRDKGKAQRDDDGRAMIHTFCRTRVRIGIDTEGTAFRFCWRCEMVLSSIAQPGPKGKEDIPAPENEETSEESNIISLDDRRVA